MLYLLLSSDLHIASSHVGVAPNWTRFTYNCLYVFWNNNRFEVADDIMLWNKGNGWYQRPLGWHRSLGIPKLEPSSQWKRLDPSGWKQQWEVALDPAGVFHTIANLRYRRETNKTRSYHKQYGSNGLHKEISHAMANLESWYVSINDIKRVLKDIRRSVAALSSGSPVAQFWASCRYILVCSHRISHFWDFVNAFPGIFGIYT